MAAMGWPEHGLALAESQKGETTLAFSPGLLMVTLATAGTALASSARHTRYESFMKRPLPSIRIRDRRTRTAPAQDSKNRNEFAVRMAGKWPEHVMKITRDHMKVRGAAKQQSFRRMVRRPRQISLGLCAFSP